MDDNQQDQQGKWIPEDAAEAWRRGRASALPAQAAGESAGEASGGDGPEELEDPPVVGGAAEGLAALAAARAAADREESTVPAAPVGAGRRGKAGVPPPRAPRSLPEPAPWGAPADLQAGAGYRGQALAPLGYVPAYPAPPGVPLEEPEGGPGLLEYWRLLQRRKGTVFLVAAIGLIVAVLVTLPMTPVYTARTWIEIQETNRDFLNMRGVQQFSSESGGYMLLTDIQTQIRILQSGALLERVDQKLREPAPEGGANAAEVAGKLGLAGSGADGGAGAAEPAAGTPGRLAAWRRALRFQELSPEQERLAALGMAFGTLKARAQGQTRIIELTAESTDRKLAAEFLNVLAAEFIDQNMESRWQQTQKTGEWLARQLDEMKIKLERSEDQLQEYARKSELLYTEDKNSVSEERLKQLQTALSAATAERVSKQSRYEMARSAAPETLPDVINDTGLRDLQLKLTELHRQAAELRATYNDKYPKLLKLEPQIRWLEGQFQKERAAILARIQNEHDEALRKETLLRGDYDAQARLVRTEGEKAVHYRILRREVETNRQLYESMLQKVKEASIASAIRASNIRVVDPAKPPPIPSRPNLRTNAVLGLLAGLVLGMALVVVTDKANKTFRDPGDVQFYLNLPELGVIPSEKAQTGSYAKRKLRAAVQNEKMLLGGGRNGELTDRVELAIHQQKGSMLAESIRATLTSILFLSLGAQRPKALVVTSSGPGEGKSTVIANLAAALGEIHQRVLLIDADTRKPRQHEIFGVPNDEGLTTLLLDQRDPLDVDLELVVTATAVQGVFLLPAGPSVPSVTTLLYSGRMEQYMAILSELFDVVLIDTPPMLQIPDARVLGRMAGGVVLVLRAGKTTRDAASAVRQRLQEDGTKIMGTILNDWNPKAAPGGYYGYTEGYYSSYKSYYGKEQ
jgi:polysaccharide biosynthesis transport protein